MCIFIVCVLTAGSESAEIEYIHMCVGGVHLTYCIWASASWFESEWRQPGMLFQLCSFSFNYSSDSNQSRMGLCRENFSSPEAAAADNARQSASHPQLGIQWSWVCGEFQWGLIYDCLFDNGSDLYIWYVLKGLCFWTHTTIPAPRAHTCT